ncbi:hypothetical protein BGX38DRAFT_1270422 [Terfezia claveryi]|nr:hypothetical protein BGX38DRAFT_1270422 [Terfezia claveryi]
MPQRKRKDNPGKLDKCNPPLKTRLPVTGHPATVEPQVHPDYTVHQSPPVTQVHPDHTAHQSPQAAQVHPPVPDDTVHQSLQAAQVHPQVPDHTVHQKKVQDVMSYLSSKSPMQLAVQTIAIQSLRTRSQNRIGAYKAFWCLREILRITNTDLDAIGFDGNAQGIAQSFEEFLVLGGAAWVNGTSLILPTTSPAPPPPPPTSVTDTSTQTTPPTPAQKPTTNSVSTNTDHSPTTTYAEAATGSVKKQVVIPKEKIAPPPEESQAPPESSTPPPESQRGKAPPETRSKVLHAAPTKFKPGQMRRWIEEDNKLTGVQILGIRWLTQEHRRAGKMASSLVIYMKDRINLDQGLRMGRRLFRTTGSESPSSGAYRIGVPEGSVQDGEEGLDIIELYPRIRDIRLDLVGGFLSNRPKTMRGGVGLKASPVAIELRGDGKALGLRCGGGCWPGLLRRLPGHG